MKYKIHNNASAVLMVMVVMTGLTLLLTSCWQAAGWSNDLILVRQQGITRFYVTEVVRNYTVVWAKKNFDQLIKSIDPVVIDGGVIMLGLREQGNCVVTIDKLLGNNQDNIIRLKVVIMVDSKKVVCHRCFLEREVIGGKNRFIVHHVAFQ